MCYPGSGDCLRAVPSSGITRERLNSHQVQVARMQYFLRRLSSKNSHLTLKGESHHNAYGSLLSQRGCDVVSVKWSQHSSSMCALADGHQRHWKRPGCSVPGSAQAKVKSLGATVSACLGAELFLCSNYGAGGYFSHICRRQAPLAKGPHHATDKQGHAQGEFARSYTCTDLLG